MNQRSIRVGAGVAAAVLALAAPACSSDDKKDSADKKTATTIKAPSLAMTTSEIVGADTQFQKFVDLAKVAGVSADIDTEGKDTRTLLVPEQAAFDALGPGVLDTLQGDPTGDLRDLLRHHILAESMDLAALTAKAGSTVKTVAGEDLPVTFSNGNLFIANARVVKSDIRGSNGIVHVLSGVITDPTATPPAEAPAAEEPTSEDPAAETTTTGG